MTSPAAALGESAVCTTCGRPYLVSQGHACAIAPPCSGCAAAIEQAITALRAEFANQLDALDRGLVETAEIAHRAREANKAQDKAWSAFRGGEAAIAAAQGTTPPPRPRARRQSRTTPHPSRPSLSLVPPGGVA